MSAYRSRYLRNAAVTTAVTVVPSAAAFATAATHTSSGIRSERGMVATSCLPRHGEQRGVEAVDLYGISRTSQEIGDVGRDPQRHPYLQRNPRKEDVVSATIRPTDDGKHLVSCDTCRTQAVTPFIDTARRWVRLHTCPPRTRPEGEAVA